MSTEVKYYLECHVTIEPVFDEKLERVKEIARLYKFKVADLLMKKRKEDSETRSKNDTFCTGHSKNIDDIMDRVQKLISHLKQEGFQVWRAKIEDTLVDTKLDDIHGWLK